jgi:hypothetical protein
MAKITTQTSSPRATIRCIKNQYQLKQNSFRRSPPCPCSTSSSRASPSSSRCLCSKNQNQYKLPQKNILRSPLRHQLVSIRQRTAAYVSIQQHTAVHGSARQHTAAYVSIRQRTSAEQLQAERSVPALPENNFQEEDVHQLL